MSKYKGYSLVEMLITLLLVSFLLTAMALVLNTMLKASTMADSRTAARSESSFILNVLEINLSNAYTDNAMVFSHEGRRIDVDGTILVDPDSSFDERAIGSGGAGNEIHVIPTGSDRWICITHLTQLQGDQEFGYIVRTSASTALIPPSSVDATQHAQCFDPAFNTEVYDYLTYLNSDEVSIITEDGPEGAFGVSYYQGADDNNYYILNITARPDKWVGGEQALLRPFYDREVVVKSQKLKL